MSSIFFVSAGAIKIKKIAWHLRIWEILLDTTVTGNDAWRLSTTRLAKVRAMAEKELEAMRSNVMKHENDEPQMETKKTAPVFTDTAFIAGKTDARLETE